MRWTILILNLLAIIVLQFLASVATAAHRTHAYSIYHELVANQAIVDQPVYTNGKPLDVEARLRTIGSGGYYSMLANVASVVCLISGITFFVGYKATPKHDDTA